MSPENRLSSPTTLAPCATTHPDQNHTEQSPALSLIVPHRSLVGFQRMVSLAINGIGTIDHDAGWLPIN